MNAVLQQKDIAPDFLGEFFAPASSDMVDGLVGQYRNLREKIDQAAALFKGEMSGVMQFFIDGNSDGDRRYSLPDAERLLSPQGAIAALNAHFWSKTLSLTDVYDMMPQKRRDEWNDQIRKKTCPDFEEETVRSTMIGLLNSRSKFFGERVDGIFRGLSSEHVTNCPQGFSKRMIIAYVHSAFSTSYNVCGLINDLRCVVAKFMGRDEPKHGSAGNVVDRLKGRWGEWHVIDGGALRIRIYKKGTAHLEVHPDMAWRLNAVLASMYPAAIPASFRKPPKRKPKDFVLMLRPLPFAVLDLIGGMDEAYEQVKNGYRDTVRRIPRTRRFSYHSIENTDKHVLAESRRVIESIGGVLTDDYYQFDYEPAEVIADIVVSGCIPDYKSHQYYPTPEKLARLAVEMAEIGENDRCLEPSAGQGGLADFLPKDRTTCIEVSPLHCQILEGKGYKTIRADFIDWADYSPEPIFNRVIANPPYSDGRWSLHVETAASLVAKEGRIIAILPASAAGKFKLPGFDLTWSQVFDNEFSGSSISVVIMTGARQ